MIMELVKIFFRRSIRFRFHALVPMTERVRSMSWRVSRPIVTAA